MEDDAIRSLLGIEQHLKETLEEAIMYTNSIKALRIINKGAVGATAMDHVMYHLLKAHAAFKEGP